VSAMRAIDETAANDAVTLGAADRETAPARIGDASADRLRKRLARAMALLRLRGYVVIEPRVADPARVNVAGPFVLDMESATLRFRATRLRLTPFKCLLLRALMDAEGEWCSRRSLRMLLWGELPPPSDALAVHMHALRSQLIRLTGKDVIVSGRQRGFRLAFERFDGADEGTTP